MTGHDAGGGAGDGKGGGARARGTPTRYTKRAAAEALDAPESVRPLCALADELTELVGHPHAPGTAPPGLASPVGAGAGGSRWASQAGATEQLFEARLAALVRPLRADASRLVSLVCELDRICTKGFHRERTTSLTGALDLVIQALLQLHTTSEQGDRGGNSLAEQLHRESFVDVSDAAKDVVAKRLAKLRGQVRCVGLGCVAMQPRLT